MSETNDGGPSPTMSQFNDLREQLFATEGKLEARIDRVDEKLNRVAGAVARLEGDMLEVKRDVFELKSLVPKFDRFQTVLDGMTRQLESFERWFRFQGKMLVEHEGRIAKLEAKPQ